jgi:energy-coupling factor transport system permease protein
VPVGYSVYRDTGSTIHRGIDPRTKMTWLLALFAVALCFNHPLVLGAFMAAVLGVAIAARLSWRDLHGFVLLALWLIALSLIIWPAYIHEGRLVGRLIGIDFTVDGLLFGLAMGLRITLMIFAAAVWMLTTSPQRITAGLLAIGLPYKVGLALSSTIRFIPLMNAERTTILEAQRARGLDLSRGNPIRRMFRAAPVLVPLFSRAFLTTQTLTVAMDARGFGAGKGRTSIVTLHFGTVDKLLTAAAVLTVVVAIVCRIMGWGVLIEGTL